MRCHVLALILLACAAPDARAADLFVDAAGSPGSHATVALAQQAAAPGDRIFVLPGHYPAFLWTKSVRILGLGAKPEDVVIARIDFAPKFPTLGYDMLLSNVMLDSADPLDAVKLSGNELPPGVLSIDGVVIKGAVYLGSGPQGMHVSIVNCRIEPAPGQGVLGTAVYLGGLGNYATYSAEIVDSTISAHAATAALPAQSALRISGGVRLRLSGANLNGGHSAVAVPGLSNGADALRMGFVAGSVQVDLDGGTTILGGSSIHGAGGAGVALDGHLTIAQALVLGGSGVAAGTPFAGSAPVPREYSLRLSTVPPLFDAVGPTSFAGGRTVRLQTAHSAPAAGIAIAPETNQPGTWFTPLLTTSTVLFPGHELVFALPVDASPAANGLLLFAQGYYLHPDTQTVEFTNSRSLRADL